MHSQDKRPVIFLVLWICLLCLLAAGCAREESRPIIMENPANTVPSATVTAAIPTMTSTSAITTTTTPVSVVLPAVTLSPQEAEDALQELLNTNGNCTGKCLAGIRPDEMTVQQAVDRMAQWGMLWTSDDEWGKGIHTFYLDPSSRHINVNLDMVLRPASETTYGISFYIPRHEDGEFLGADVWQANREAWKAFSFDHLLQAYGIPSFAGFRMESSDAEPDSIEYTLYVLYEPMNIDIGIGGLAHTNGQEVLICPSRDPHSLGIDINPEVSLGVPVEKAKQITPITWQALTGTDLPAFYKIFTDEGSPDACITTTLDKIRELDPSFR